MPHLATETFSRGKFPLPRTRSLLACWLLAFSVGAATQNLPAQDEVEPATAVADNETLTASDHPVPFPRIVRLAEAAYGPPPPRVLARLGGPPDWSQLDRYQHTMLRAEFEHQLRSVYAANDDAWKPHIRILPDRALIRRQSNWEAEGWYELKFRRPNSQTAKPQSIATGPPISNCVPSSILPAPFPACIFSSIPATSAESSPAPKAAGTRSAAIRFPSWRVK